MNLIPKVKNYLGNPKLKRVGVIQKMTEHEVTEFYKCSQSK